MEHAPIYRSTARRTTRTTSTSLIPWQRTASLASAAAALTLSGIALGYHGFATTTASSPGTSTTDTVSARNVDVPVPGISLAIADGGHPDVISALSSALIAQVQTAQLPLLSLPIGPLVQPIGVALPQPTAEPFVLPTIVLGPIADPTVPPADTLIAPAADATAADEVAPAPTTDELIASDVNVEPFVAARAVSPTNLTVAAADDAAATADDPQADAPADPQDQVAAEVVPQAEPAAAPAPVRAAAKSSPPAPVRVATPVPVVHKPTPEPVKLQPLPDRDAAPQVELKRSPLPAEPPAAHANNGDNDAHTAPSHAADPKPNDKPDKGKGGAAHGG